MSRKKPHVLIKIFVQLPCENVTLKASYSVACNSLLHTLDHSIFNLSMGKKCLESLFYYVINVNFEIIRSCGFVSFTQGIFFITSSSLLAFSAILRV